MIHVPCVQGGPEWHKARLGVVTASCFDKILTPKTRKPAKGDAYLHQLVAEWMLGRPVDESTDAHRERGTEMEAEALGWYCTDQGVDVEEVGFLLRDDRRVGASPDGLIGKDGGFEMKNPLAVQHVAYMLNPDALVDDYRHQVQGGMLVAERSWWDLLSYNPEMPPVLVRVERDEEYLSALAPALDAFLARLDDAKAQLAEARDAAYADNPLL